MRNILLLVTMIATFCCSGCMYAVRYDGEYRGKVYDGETKQPIEGAVVLGIWHIVHPSPGGSWDEYYDARETLTDKNGEFSISGQGLKVLSNMEPMSVMVYKSGYKPTFPGPWDNRTTKKDLDGPIYDKVIDRTSFPYMGKYDKVYFFYVDSNNIVNFPLRKLTQKEKNNREGHPSRPSIPENKMPLMTREINKYRVELGLDTFTIRGGEK